MASTSKSYDPSPERERFQRLNRAKPSGSERAASPSEASSDDDSSGGARLDYVSASPDKYTPPHARGGTYRSQFAEAMRRNKTESPDYMAPAADDDDVFVSPSKSIKERRSERSSAQTDIQRLNVGLANQDDNAVRARNSNLSARHQINGVDAQNLYPPTACVFVANLPEPKDDVTLEAALYREFLKYGKCWIKIRRDAHHMPFAFVQYITDAEAQLALVKGKGALIHGRACRTEPVKANRTFVIQKKNGTPITIQEAEEALLPFGSLSKIEELHPDLRTPLEYPPTILVEFSMFDATRDLHTAFRSDNIYTVLAFDLKKNCAFYRNNGDEAFLAACERDRRSIFVGDLPASTSQFDLEELFAEAGDILKINVIQRAPTQNQGNYHGYSASQMSPSQIKTMAFIEFTQPDMPETAIALFHGKKFRNATLRVERKSVKDRGNPLPRHNRAPLPVAPRLSEETMVTTPARTANTFVLSGSASASRAQQSVPAMVTPARGRAQSRAYQMTSPTAMAPPMYPQWPYNPVSPYAPNSPYAQAHGWDVTGTGPYGGAVMPATPSATPYMASPYSYYYNNWAGMSPYDQNAHYPGAYAFQSPTPMMNTGMNGPPRSLPAGGESGVDATPTRARGGSSAAQSKGKSKAVDEGNDA